MWPRPRRSLRNNAHDPLQPRTGLGPTAQGSRPKGATLGQVGRQSPNAESVAPSLKHFYEIAGSIHLISLNPVRPGLSSVEGRERPIHLTWHDIARIHVVLGIWFDSSS